jgi:hypothetical protein
MGYVVKHSGGSVNNARKKGNVVLGVDADGYDKTSVSGFYAGVAPVPGFHNLVRTSATTDPDFYTLTDLELVNFANSLGGSASNVTEAKVYLASQNDVMFTDEVPEDVITDGLILEIDASNLSSYPGSGTSIYDLSGEGNNGTLINGPTFDPDGAIVFDGTNDHVTLGGATPISLQGNPAFTVEGWFKISGDWSGGSTWGIGGSGQNINSYNHGNTNGISIDLWGNTTLSSPEDYSSDVYKHCVWTYNGSTFTTSNIIIYVNGVAYTGNDFTVHRGNSGTTPNINSAGMVLGRAGVNVDNYYGKPIINKFRIYDRVLSQSEILQNYYNGDIVTNNLYAAFDPDNLVSYESGSNTIYNLANPTDTTSDGVINSTVEVSLEGNLKFGGDGSLVSSNRNTYVEYTNVYPTGSFDFPGWDGYSVGIWVKRTKYGTWQSGGGNLDGIWNYYWNHNLYFSGAHTGLNRIQGTGLSGYDINMNEWYYVVTTHDNNAVSNNHKVYVNGELVQTSNIGNPSYSNGAPRRFYVGNWDSSWSMVGEVGAYHIYDQAITADEVLQNYNTYKSRYQNQDPTLEIDGEWLKVFRHYSGDGDFFSSANDWAEAKSTNTDNPQANKYSILDTLYRYELDDKFTFKIVYPSQSLENSNYSNVTNIWSQTNNPVRENGSGGVTGYTAIDIGSTSSGWGGLERYDAQSATFLDGTLIPQGNWWWAIGSKNSYDGGNPNFPGPGQTTRLVELWIKYK